MGFRTFMNWHSLTEYCIKMMHFIQQMSPPYYYQILALLIPINGVTTDIYQQMFKHAIYKWHPLAVNNFSATTNEKSRFACWFCSQRNSQHICKGLRRQRPGSSRSVIKGSCLLCLANMPSGTVCTNINESNVIKGLEISASNSRRTSNQHSAIPRADGEDLC